MNKSPKKEYRASARGEVHPSRREWQALNAAVHAFELRRCGGGVSGGRVANGPNWNRLKGRVLAAAREGVMIQLSAAEVQMLEWHLRRVGNILRNKSAAGERRVIDFALDLLPRVTKRRR